MTNKWKMENGKWKPKGGKLPSFSLCDRYIYDVEETAAILFLKIMLTRIIACDIIYLPNKPNIVA